MPLPVQRLITQECRQWRHDLMIIGAVMMLHTLLPYHLYAASFDDIQIPSSVSLQQAP